MGNSALLNILQELLFVRLGKLDEVSQSARVVAGNHPNIGLLYGKTHDEIVFGMAVCHPMDGRREGQECIKLGLCHCLSRCVHYGYSILGGCLLYTYIGQGEQLSGDCFLVALLEQFHKFGYGLRVEKLAHTEHQSTGSFRHAAFGNIFSFACGSGSYYELLYRPAEKQSLLAFNHAVDVRTHIAPCCDRHLAAVVLYVLYLVELMLPAPFA